MTEVDLYANELFLSASVIEEQVYLLLCIHSHSRRTPFKENMATTTTNVRRGNAVSTKGAPDLLPVFSQAIRTKDAIFVSGNIGVDPSTGQLVQGVKEQTVRYILSFSASMLLWLANVLISYLLSQIQILKNFKAVLEAAGLGLGHVVKVNVYITDMRNFEAMNEAYLGVFEDPQPVSQLWPYLFSFSSAA